MLTKITFLSTVILLFIAGCTSTNDLAIEEAIQILDIVQKDQTFVQKKALPLRNAFIVVKDKTSAYVSINTIFKKDTKEAETYILKKDENDMWHVDSVRWTSNTKLTPNFDTFSH